MWETDLFQKVSVCLLYISQHAHTHKEIVHSAVHLNFGTNMLGEGAYFSFQFCDTLRTISIVIILKNILK